MRALVLCLVAGCIALGGVAAHRLSVMGAEDEAPTSESGGVESPSAPSGAEGDLLPPLSDPLSLTAGLPLVPETDAAAPTPLPPGGGPAVAPSGPPPSPAPDDAAAAASTVAGANAPSSPASSTAAADPASGAAQGSSSPPSSASDNAADEEALVPGNEEADEAAEEGDEEQLPADEEQETAEEEDETVAGSGGEGGNGSRTPPAQTLPEAPQGVTAPEGAATGALPPTSSISAPVLMNPPLPSAVGAGTD